MGKTCGNTVIVEITRTVLCPYWQRTDYGTVRCNFLDKEVVDEEDSEAREKIMKYFGISNPEEKFAFSWALPDEVKICGIKENEIMEWGN